MSDMHSLPLDFTAQLPRARAKDPETSQIAAAAVVDFDGEHFAAILAALAFGNGTIHEVAARAKLTAVQVARRMPELEQGLKVRVVKDLTRPSPSGRPCRVWERT